MGPARPAGPRSPGAPCGIGGFAVSLGGFGGNLRAFGVDLGLSPPGTPLVSPKSHLGASQPILPREAAVARSALWGKTRICGIRGGVLGSAEYFWGLGLVFGFWEGFWGCRECPEEEEEEDFGVRGVFLGLGSVFWDRGPVFGIGVTTDPLSRWPQRSGSSGLSAGSSLPFLPGRSGGTLGSCGALRTRRKTGHEEPSSPP